MIRFIAILAMMFSFYLSFFLVSPVEFSDYLG